MRSGASKYPLEFVTSGCDTFVSTLVIFTLAPGRTPSLSRTVPEIEPRVSWAAALQAISSAQIMDAILSTFRMDVPPQLQLVSGRIVAFDSGRSQFVAAVMRFGLTRGAPGARR